MKTEARKLKDCGYIVALSRVFSTCAVLLVGWCTLAAGPYSYRYVISFQGRPEGQVDATKGQLLLDELDGEAWIKTTPAGLRTGWKRFATGSDTSAIDSNWRAEGLTNSTLKGLGRPWAIEATNHVSVGSGSGERGEIEIASTNALHELTVTVDDDGTFWVKYGSTNMLRVKVGSSSGYTGTGTNLLADDGVFRPIPYADDSAYDAAEWDGDTDAPSKNAVRDKIESLSFGPTVNPTDGWLPYRANATTLGDSPWYRISSKKLGFANTALFLFNDTGSDQLSTGFLALSSLTSGGGNHAFGNQALTAVTTGSYNDAFGRSSLRALTTGSENSAFGQAAGIALIDGDANTLMGGSAGQGLTSGTLNVLVGRMAGANQVTGSRNVFLGADTYTFVASEPQVDNAIVIGYGAGPQESNSAQIGTNGVHVLYLNGTVGWYRGTGAPAFTPVGDGSFYTREDGGAGNTFYVREAGSWVAK